MKVTPDPRLNRPAIHRAALALATLTFLLASCGSDDTAAEPTTPEPTPEAATEEIVEAEPVAAESQVDIAALRNLPKVELPTKIGDCVELTAIGKFPRLEFRKADDADFDPSWETLEQYLSFNEYLEIGVAFNAEYLPFTDLDPAPFSPYLGDGITFFEGPDFAPGNKVEVCLKVIPDCAADNKDNPNFSPVDQRGRRYQFTDAKTGASTEAGDSYRLCGGA